MSNALSFYVNKTVLVGPEWFWSDQFNLDLTIIIWSRPKWNGHDQNELLWSKLWFSTKMIHIWTWPIHFGRDHFILVVTKSLWSSPDQFGQTKTILDRPKLFWSHRMTRQKWLASWCEKSPFRILNGCTIVILLMLLGLVYIYCVLQMVFQNPSLCQIAKKARCSLNLMILFLLFKRQFFSILFTD